MSKLSVKQVNTNEEFGQFYECYIDAFKNEPDEIFTKIEVKDWIEQTRKIVETGEYLLLENDVVVGFVLFMSKDGIGNVPWAGIKTEFQGKGLYPQFIKLMTQTIFKELNINIIIRECDNPELIDGKLKIQAAKRLAMFRNKLNGKFVANKEFVFFRNDPKNSQQRTYKYLFGFSVISDDCPLDILDNKIGKRDLKKLIQYRNFFEQGVFEIEEQKRLFKSHKDFYETLDNIKEDYITIE